MAYWKAVGRATVICFVMGLMWQVGLILKMVFQATGGDATGFAFAWSGVVELLITVAAAGWILGSLWYVVSKSIRRSARP